MQWLYKTLQFFFSEYGADINQSQQKQCVYMYSILKEMYKM